MYIHPSFKASRDQALSLLRTRAFGTLVVVGLDGKPTAAHLPFLVHEADGLLRVELHVAKANPIHEVIGNAGTAALLCCLGPDAYISPTWYGAPNEVATWTYAAVHLSGHIRCLAQPENQPHVDRMVDHFETPLARPGSCPWGTKDVEPERLQAMLRAIVALEMVVDDVQAQLKLIQHKDDARHRGAIVGLRSQADAGSQAIADLMAQTLLERQQRGAAR